MYIIDEILYFFSEIKRFILRRPRGIVFFREKVLLNEKIKGKRCAGIKLKKLFTKEELKFVYVNGKKKKSRYRLKEGDICEYIKSPEGDFVADVFTIVVGAVLVVAGIATGNPILTQIGAGLIIGGSVSALTKLLFPIKPPSFRISPQEGQGTSQPPEIKGASNTISKSILPYVFGETIQTPFYAQYPYRLIADGSSTNKYRQYFISNYDNVNIYNEKIGETNVGSYSSNFLDINKSYGGSSFIGFDNVKPVPREEQLSVDITQEVFEISNEVYNQNVEGYAQGSIWYGIKPNVGSTITINGVVFTYVVTAGSPTEIAIGTTLLTALNNTVAVLNASTNPLVTPATYSNNGSDTLIIIYDSKGAEGNEFTLDANLPDGYLVTQMTGGVSTYLQYDFILEFTNVDSSNFSDKNFKIEVDILDDTLPTPSEITLSQTYLIEFGDLVLVGGTTYRYIGTKTWTQNISGIIETRFFATTDTRILPEEVEDGLEVEIVEEELTTDLFNDSYTINNPINKYIGVVSEVLETSPDDTTDIDIIIAFPVGLYKQKSDGGRESRIASINVKYKTQSGSFQDIDTATLYVRDINGNKQPLSSSTTTVNGAIVSFSPPDNINQADELFFRTIGMTLTKDKYTIKVSSADLYEKTNFDIGYPVLSEFNFYVDGDVIDETILPNVNQISVEAIAYGSLSGTLRQYNYLAKSELPIWDGTNWSTTAETRNPASIIRDLLTNDLINPRAESIDSIDNDSLVELYNWCETEDYYVDGIISEQFKILELIQTLLSNCQASFTFYNGKYYFVIDNPSKEPIDLFNQHNSFNFKWTPQIGRLTDALRIGFINNDDYSEDEITLYYYDDNVYQIPKSGTSDVDYQIIKTDYQFLTDKSSVIKLGTYALKLIQEKRNVFEFSVNLEALSLKLYDRIYISNTCDLEKESTGLIKELILSGGNLIGFKLYSFIQIEKNSQITIRSLDFTNEIPQIKVFNVLNDGFKDEIEISPIAYDGNIRGAGMIKGISEDFYYKGDIFDIGVNPIFECVIINIRYNEDLTATITAREA
ncbi:MAG: hypothetical protein BV457_00170 [Thermoplasmata archaeon M9B1D]|nr:MAG: hypothetical protein BV457_00170 [Thermoplasmata archaeon M9B1D]PNX52220.1 MAG: hypothetical protein BV456_00125 [Thermoplasmata archaeon M8B2D]